MTDQQVNHLSIPTFKVLPFINGTHFDYDEHQEQYVCVMKLADASSVIMVAEDVEIAHGNAIKVIKEMAYKNGWLNE